jgi:hypothetical protein
MSWITDLINPTVKPTGTVSTAPKPVTQGAIVNVLPAGAEGLSAKGIPISRLNVWVTDRRAMPFSDKAAYDKVLALVSKLPDWGFTAKIRDGVIPYARIKDSTSGKTYCKFYREATRAYKIGDCPPPTDRWYSSIKDGLEWLGEQIVDAGEWLIEKACKLLQNPTVAEQIKKGSTGGLTSQGVDPATASKISDVGVGYAQAKCMEKFPPSLPGSSLPSAPGPFPSSKYPTGAVTRFNVTRRTWSVYVPIGLGDIEAPVVPAPPAGMRLLGEEPAQPALPVVGEERDARWYDSIYTKVGGGLAAIAVTALVYRKVRNKRRGR